MTWTKLSDDFGDDCHTLSDLAFRLHVEGLCWSNRKLLDCHIPTADLRRFATHPDAAQELVDVGWWSQVPDGFIIRHHATYQRTREQVLNQQSANVANGRKGGRPRVVRTEPETHSQTESLTESKTERDGTGQASTGAQLWQVRSDLRTPDHLRDPEAS